MHTTCHCLTIVIDICWLDQASVYKFIEIMFSMFHFALPRCQNLCITGPLFGNDIVQDEGLDIIGEGLATLKNMAADMNEVSSFASFLVI